MTETKLTLPPLYAILDADAVEKRGTSLLQVASELRKAGVLLLQYRDKRGSADVVLQNARDIADVFNGTGCLLILNDRPELVTVAGWNGVHLGQQDSSAEQARLLIGKKGVIGLSTHTLEQAIAAERRQAVDYVAFGPIFATDSKQHAEPAVGLHRLRTVRRCVTKPLVGIGGVSVDTVRAVVDAGANSVAVIGALFQPSATVETSARQLLNQLSL